MRITGTLPAFHIALFSARMYLIQRRLAAGGDILMLTGKAEDSPQEKIKIYLDLM